MPAQYLSYAQPPEVLDLDVTVAVAGKQITQARAVGHVADREVFTVNAALGRRNGPHEASWAAMPDVPPPDECARRELRLPTDSTSLADRLDVRVAMGRGMAELPVPAFPTADRPCGPGCRRSSTCPPPLWPSSATMCACGTPGPPRRADGRFLPPAAARCPNRPPAVAAFRWTTQPIDLLRSPGPAVTVTGWRAEPTA